jgi:hypothetical protein
MKQIPSVWCNLAEVAGMEVRYWLFVICYWMKSEGYERQFTIT